jgi:hypothetical protein
LDAANVDGSIPPNDKSTDHPELHDAGMNVLPSVANRDVPLESRIDAYKITSPNKRNLPVRCLINIGNIELELEVPLCRASHDLELAAPRSFFVSQEQNTFWTGLL